MKLHGHERQLIADDCPLQHLVQLGQLSAAVQFILRRTGPSLSEGPSTPTRERRLPRSRSSEQQTVDHTVPQKAFSSSTHPRWTTPSQTWSPSPRASPEPRASPISFLNSHHPVVAASSSLKEVYRQTLQQQKRLQDLQHQLQSLERETELWECERSSGPGLSLNPGEMEELEEQLRQNETELMLTGHWEKQLGTEMDRELGLCSSVITHSTFLSSSSDISKFKNIYHYHQQTCTDIWSSCTHPWMITATGSCSL